MITPHEINIKFNPPNNRRVTNSTSQNARSESSIAINPANPYNIVASSKKFSDPTKYEFSLAIYTTFDGGETWTESAPPKLLDGWAGVSDPALAWDISQSTTSATNNTVYLVALPFAPDDGPLLGIAIYQSNDGGSTWSSPKLIHSGSGDDKQWAVGDYNPLSPYFGNVYAVWDDGPGLGFSSLAFARTIDHGNTWIGLNGQNAGSHIEGIQDSGSPEISVASALFI